MDTYSLFIWCALWDQSKKFRDWNEKFEDIVIVGTSYLIFQWLYK